MAIGIDLYLDAAVGVDAFGNDRHHVHAVDFGRDDKWRRLVVGISRAGADSGDDWRGSVDDIAAPLLRLAHKGHDLAAVLHGAFKQHVGIDAHQFAIVVGVTIACASHAWPDVAEHRAGIAADLVVRLGHSRHYHTARNRLCTNDLAVRSCCQARLASSPRRISAQQQRPGRQPSAPLHAGPISSTISAAVLRGRAFY